MADNVALEISDSYRRPGPRLYIYDFANIVKLFVGSNFLSIPFMFAQCGLALGSVGLVIIALLTAHCCHLLVKCKYHAIRHVANIQRPHTFSNRSRDDFCMSPASLDFFKDLFNVGGSLGADRRQFAEIQRYLLKRMHYSDLAFLCLGRFGLWLTNAAIAVTQLGFCINYAIFTANAILAFYPVHNCTLQLQNNVSIISPDCPFLGRPYSWQMGIDNQDNKSTKDLFTPPTVSLEGLTKLSDSELTAALSGLTLTSPSLPTRSEDSSFPRKSSQLHAIQIRSVLAPAPKKKLNPWDYFGPFKKPDSRFDSSTQFDKYATSKPNPFIGTATTIHDSKIDKLVTDNPNLVSTTKISQDSSIDKQTTQKPNIFTSSAQTIQDSDAKSTITKLIPSISSSKSSKDPNINKVTTTKPKLSSSTAETTQGQTSSTTSSTIYPEPQTPTRTSENQSFTSNPTPQTPTRTSENQSFTSNLTPQTPTRTSENQSFTSNLTPQTPTRTSENQSFTSNLTVRSTTTVTSGRSDLSPAWNIVWSDGPDLRLLFLFPVLVFLALVLPRRLRGLGVVSVVGNLAILLGMLVMFAALVLDFQLIDDWQWFRLQGLPTFFGAVSSAFEGAGTILPVEGSMDGNRHNFAPFLYLGIALLMAMHVAMNALSYLSHGSSTLQIMTMNLPQGSPFKDVINGSLMVGILLTFPLMVYPVVNLAEAALLGKGRVYKDSDTPNDASLLLSPSRKKTSFDDGGRPWFLQSLMWKRNVIRISIVLLVGGLAVLLRNDFAYVSAFVGAVGSTLLAFVLPCVLHIRLCWSSLPLLVKLKDVAIVIVGLCFSISGLYVVIVQKVV